MSSPLSELLGAPLAKPRRLIYRRVFASSAVVEIPAGIYDIMAIGAAGSGAAVKDETNGRATGGGGPGFSRKGGRSAVPHNLTITLGARALGVLRGTNGASPGNSGGTTTVVGTGINISITGGGAGQAATTAISVPGGDGGVATGGDINHDGSRGGDIQTTATGTCATGGGALDLFGLGNDATRGGDISTSNLGVAKPTGGGGVGGHGGDITGSSANSNTGGGGAGGDAPENVTQGLSPDINGRVASASRPDPWSVADVLAAYPSLEPTGAGSNAEPVAPGGGGRGGLFATIPLGGSGALVSNSSAAVASGLVELGGGSGGCVNQGTSTAASGDAGAARVIVSVYEEVN